MRNFLTVVAVAVFAGCGLAGAHEHHAPHKGTLVEFGEEFAHLELVLDLASGKMSAYVLDGEAEKAVRVKQNQITLVLADGSEVELKAQANVLSGETEGDTSEFAGQSEKLKGAANFDAKVKAITVKGTDFKDVKFNYPKGNEEPAKK